MAVVLPEYNLYAQGSIQVFGEGNQLMSRKLLDLDFSQDGQYHTVKQNDRLDVLAYTYYDDLVERGARYWWVIADANNILNPLDLSELVGQEILIPDILKVRLNL